mgnify:CR=1 FL=1
MFISWPVPYAAIFRGYMTLRTYRLMPTSEVMFKICILIYIFIYLQQLLSNLHQNDTCSEYGKNTVRIPYAGEFPPCAEPRYIKYLGIEDGLQ